MTFKVVQKVAAIYIATSSETSMFKKYSYQVGEDE